MNTRLTKVFSKLLRDIADKVDAGTCEIEESQAMDVISMLSHTPLSKDQACSHLNMSRSKFDELVREGKIPPGKKVRGFKELRWYVDEIELAMI